jgi:hypothetical protein
LSLNETLPPPPPHFLIKLTFWMPIYKQDCDRGTAKCFMFRCNIRNLQRKQSAVIKIRARSVSRLLSFSLRLFSQQVLS